MIPRCIPGACLALMACGGCSDFDSDRTAATSVLDITGESVALRVAAEAVVAVTLREDGIARPVLSNWAVRDTSVAGVRGSRVDAARVTARRPGATWLVATDGSRYDSVPVVVTPVFGGRWEGSVSIEGQPDLSGHVSLDLDENYRQATGTGTVTLRRSDELVLKVLVGHDSPDVAGIEWSYPDRGFVRVLWTAPPGGDTLIAESSSGDVVIRLVRRGSR